MIEAIYILIIGVALLFLGYTKKAGKFNTAAMAVGVLMVIGGAVWPGYGIWEGEMALDGVSAEDGTVDIAMINGSWTTGDIIATTDSDEQGCTYQLNQDGTHTFDETYLSANFTFSPVAGIDADDNDLITVKFSIPGNEVSYDGDDVWDETTDIEDIDWFHNGIVADDGDKDIAGCSGSITMKYTDTDYLTFTAELDSGAADSFAHNMDTVGESYTIPITFTYLGQTETFDINFVVITNA